MNILNRGKQAFALVIIMGAFLLSVVAQAQQPQMNLGGRQLSKETQLKLLRLHEARVSLQAEQDLYEDYVRDHEDLKELYADDIVTGKEVSDAETEVKDAARRLELAKIDLAKTALSFLQESTHISIVEAYQYIDTQNNRHMSITLLNDSDLELAMLGLGEGVPEAGIKKEDVPGLLTIENLYVSVRVGATVIGDPFEMKVSQMPLDETASLDFKLNSEADEVTVSLKYHNTEESRNIFLQKKSVEDIVRVSSLQFAQEGLMGNWVEYGIDLERLAEDEATFTLAVINLPENYQHKFTDQGNQLSRVKFSQGVTRHSLTFRVNVPDTLPIEELRQPIQFYVIVGDDESVDTLKDYETEGGDIGDDQLDLMKVGYEELELTPRGTGELEAKFDTTYHEIKIGDLIESKMTVENTGSVKLTNIRFELDLPPDWHMEFKPDGLETIEPRTKEEVMVTITPPEGVEVGGYELKVECETEYEGSSVKTTEKVIKVQVEAQANVKGTMMLVGGLVFFILLLVVVTIRISRR